MWSPNPRLQRTHLRAPLSRKTFAAIPRSASLKRSAACGVAFLPVLAVVMGCLRPVVDYSFRAEGVVTDPGGRPIPNARVTLEISRTVYKVITPVTKSDTYTDENGRFAFGYPRTMRIHRTRWVSRSWATKASCLRARSRP